MENKFDNLILDNMISFPLYACARETIKLYNPFLNEIDLTYTQLIAMMVLWQKGPISVKEMGDALYLDSGTLTPLLKKLEAKGLLTRRRSAEDERVLIVSLTEKGQALREQAMKVPPQMLRRLNLSLEVEEGKELWRLLNKFLRSFREN